MNNLLLNGSFENNNCTPNVDSGFCPSSLKYNCTIPDWICSGGGPGTYASVYNSVATVVPDGSFVLYFGNDFCNACSAVLNDTSCLINIDCAVTGIPDGYPQNTATFGGVNGVSLEQSVSGLIVGNTYVLEFWAGGENSYAFPNMGLFAVDVGFGDTLLRCKPSSPGWIATTYIIEFKATSASQTIKFTNWGHICTSCTELMLDNVRLYAVAELSPVVPTCITPSANYFNASDTNICEKFCINFFDSSINNPTAWQWEFPGGDPSFSIDQNPISICYATPGTYDVTLITTNAYGSDTLTLSDYITVYSTPPFPTLTQVGLILTSSPATTYQWQLDAVDISGATSQSYTVLQSGTYTVIIGDSNGCVNSSSLEVLISGIDEVNKDAGISVYPNPSNGIFTLELKYANISEIDIRIFNLLGQEIFSAQEKTMANNKFTKEIDLTGKPSGSYILNLSSGSTLMKSKLILIK
ncbi:MAG: T9SS type A sorting domain-containing protein [Chitinophagales bacterium]